MTRIQRTRTNPVTLKAGLSIGSFAAETDDEYLFDCFIQNPATDCAADVHSPGMILAGRTGSGKTAIMRFINHNGEHIAIIDPFEMALSYVANSDVLRFLHQIGADLDLFFQVLWKHVLCIEYIRLPGLFNALYKPLYERLMLGSIAAIQSASAILVTPFARAMLSA